MPGERHRHLRVMLDASVLISGTVWQRWPYEVIAHARNGDYQLVLTPLLIAEARDTIAVRWPEWRGLFDETLLASGYELVPDVPLAVQEAHADLVRDPNDLHVALAAIQAGVDYLVSEDKDLTDRHDPRNATLHAQLRVLIAGTFLRTVMGWTSEQLEAARQRPRPTPPPGP